MNVFENPFNILGATTRDNRAKINQLTEEKSLLTGSDDECTEARNILTNPSKRLAAEVRWFPGLSPNNIKTILEYVMNPDEEELDINSFNSLAKLHILSEEFDYYNTISGYRVDSHSDLFITCLIIVIKEINTVFEEIDFNEILLIINEDRTISGFPQIEDTKPIEKEIRQMRLEIQDLFNNSLSQYVQEEYIEIINRLANECIDENEILEGVIINDLLESYKLQTKELIDEKKNKLISLTERIEKEAFFIDNFELFVNEIIQKVEDFDRIAQPLQLKARSEGTKHEASEEVAFVIRHLAVILNNDYKATDQAIKLSNCLKNSFAELDEFAEIMETDSETLDSINQQREAVKTEHNRMVVENTCDNNYSVKLSKNNFAIPPYCTCCFGETAYTESIKGEISRTYFRTTKTRTISLKFPICNNCLKHRKQISFKKWTLIWSSFIIATGIFAILCIGDIDYNTLVGIYAGIAIAIFIAIGYYLKLPYITPDHSTWENSVQIIPTSMDGNEVIFIFTNWRYAFWFAKANDAELSVSKSKSTVKNNKVITSLDHPYLVALSVLCLVLLFSIFIGPSMYQSIASNPQTKSSAQNQSKSQNYSNTQASNPQTNYSSQNQSKSQNYSNSQASNPQTNYSSQNQSESQRYLNNNSSDYYRDSQMRNLENEIESQERKIKSIEQDLASLEWDLESKERMLKLNYDDFYIDSYNRVAKEYREKYEDYEKEIERYNELVSKYNRLL